MGGGDERRREENHDLMLQHVGRKQLLSKFMDGRNESERYPAYSETEMTPAKRVGVAPANRADHINRE